MDSLRHAHLSTRMERSLVNGEDYPLILTKTNSGTPSIMLI
jgi:hypothetical protein